MYNLNFTGLYALSCMKNNIPTGTIFRHESADERVLAQAKNQLDYVRNRDSEFLKDDLNAAISRWSRSYPHEQDIVKILFLSLPQQQAYLKSMPNNSPEYLKAKFIIDNQNLFKTSNSKAFEADKLAYKIQCGIVIQFLTVEEAYELWGRIYKHLRGSFQNWNEFGIGCYLGHGLSLAHSNSDTLLPLKQTQSILSALALQKDSPWLLNTWNA